MIELQIGFVALSILQVVDIVTTYRIIKAGGRECNPIMAAILERIGVLKGLILVKAVFLAFVGVVAWLLAGIHLLVAIALLVVIYGFTCLSNLSVLKGLKNDRL